MTPRTPVPPSDLHWQAPDRHQRALPPCGLRNDASLVMHLYDVPEEWVITCSACWPDREVIVPDPVLDASTYECRHGIRTVHHAGDPVDLNEPLPLEEVEA